MLYGKRKVMVVLIVAALVVSASAQTRRRAAKPAEEKPANSVSLVERAPGEYLSGEANVVVSGNQNPVIKLGLSPNGATIVEFPASDKLFNIIPGNSNLVTVEESPTKETDRFVIMRPGDGFASPTTMAQMRRAPATSVIVQMTSGLVITFLFYPVPQLAEQAHRVVVIYDRNEVVASRRAAGLAVNLDSNGEDKRRSTTSLRVTPPPSAPAEGEATTEPRAEVAQAPPKLLADVTYVDTSQPPEKSDLKKVDPGRAAGVALIEAIKSPESFKKWSDSAHGLSLSASPVSELDKRLQMVVVAVRNTRKSDARIIPGQPEIYVETVNDKGKPLAVDPVRKVAVRTTATDEIIVGGRTAYYALVYEAPILGARQRLRVAVGRTTAADEPSTAVLNR
ncbi:MAG: hypothetical protein MOB07_13035 [Acidobacteria bacterium]|nr:hypothetical protein [Acidobacteriota bacterium]